LLTGGQTPPRFHRWINEDVTIFLQFDSSDPAEATSLRDIGITAPTTAGAHEFLCTFGGHPELGMVGTLIVE
jgi:plastocyanin